VFSSCFSSANFVVIPARYTRAPAMAVDELEHDKKRVAKRTKK
jgi:hypothetical protein